MLYVNLKKKNVYHLLYKLSDQVILSGEKKTSSMKHKNFKGAHWFCSCWRELTKEKQVIESAERITCFKLQLPFALLENVEINILEEKNSMAYLLLKAVT